MGAYCATKAALTRWTKTLAEDTRTRSWPALRTPDRSAPRTVYVARLLHLGPDMSHFDEATKDFRAARNPAAGR